jgi:hypothetical protein
MSHTVRYRTTRLGVWRFYWRTWRSRLWIMHIATAAIYGLVALLFMPGLRDLAGWAVASLIALAVVVVVSAAIPQFRFRSAERVLTVDASGWSTQIGSKSGARSWRATLPIYEQSGAVVIPSTRTIALIIPDSAFASEAERHQFIRDVAAWQSGHGNA